MHPEQLTEAEVLELSKLSERKKRNIKQSIRYNFLANKKTRYERFIQSLSPKPQIHAYSSSSSPYFEKPRKTGSSRNFTTADKLVVVEEKENQNVC